MNKPNLKVEQGRKTQQSLLEIARHLFSTIGYGKTTTQEVISIEGITKGALYHHFKSKRALFRSVYLQCEQEVASLIDTASSAVDEPWEKLLSGCFAYLEGCSDPGRQRIMRIDSQSVLDPEDWKLIDEQFGLNRILPFLVHLSETGVIEVPSVAAFARQLTGAMNETTFWIVEQPDTKQALKLSQQTLAAFMLGVKK